MMSKFTLVIIAMFIAVSAFGQALTGQASTDRIAGTDASVKELAKGEHLPLIYTGTDILPKGGGASRTSWMPTGWSPSIGVKSYQGIIDNQALTRYDPKFFTLICDFDTLVANPDHDSIGIGTIIAEFAIDTTAKQIWNADSSNFVIYPAFGYNHDIYGQWTFQGFSESMAKDTTAHAYPVRGFFGGYMRFHFIGYALAGNILQDTTQVHWTFIVKH